MNKKYLVTAFIFMAVSTVIFSQTSSASFKVPAYEKTVLKNGLTVYLMEQHEVPMVNVSAIFPAGAIYDGRQSGLATMTAEALMHGTKNKSKSQIEEELDFIGATVSTYASKEAAGLSAKFA